MNFRSILERASECSGIPVSALYGPSQQMHLCAVRCAVYHVAQARLGMSSTAIGARMSRHHTTILNACDRRDVYEKRYKDFTALIEALMQDRVKSCRFVPCRPERKPRSRKWTSEVLARVERMHSEGMTYVEIAEAMGCTFEALASARKAFTKGCRSRNLRSYSVPRTQGIR